MSITEEYACPLTGDRPESWVVPCWNCRELRRDLDRLREMYEAACARIAGQSELLGRRAERSP